jgi:hypothetical protein
MNNKALFIILFALNIISIGAGGMEAHDRSAVMEITPDFYIGTIPNKPHLTMVMERITNENHKDWYNYAKIQSNKFAQYLPNTPNRTDGTSHFKFVLESIDYNSNELWVAYITRQKDPKPNPIRGYSFIDSIDDMIEAFKHNTPDRNLEMFMTVVSNPKALITSHMGISITQENMIRQNALKDYSGKNTSMNLQAFAAKVMLMRNPERRNMITSPTANMESIIASFVPHTFVGTKEDYEKNNLPKLSLEEFTKLMNDPNESEDLFLEMYKNAVIAFAPNEKEAQFNANNYNRNRQRYLNENLDLESLISKGDAEGLNYDSVKGFHVSKEKLEAIRTKVIKEQWNDYRKPKVLFTALKRELVERAKRKGKTFSDEDYEVFLKAHPPIISMTYTQFSKTYKKPDRLVIYEENEPTKPWLEIVSNNKDYNWIFQSVYQPIEKTHFVAVSLQELATCLDKQPEKALELKEEKEVTGFSKG